MIAAARCPARRLPANSQFSFLCKGWHKKKNWLFAGSEAAGRRAAAIQSLLATATAKANGIEPMAWLSETLEKLPAWTNSRIDELLPIKNANIPQELAKVGVPDAY